MTFHLEKDIFEIVKNGTKNIEVRLNDEKRKKLKVGDTLIFFKRPLDDETIKATITDLKYYKNFSDLLEHYNMEDLYMKDYSKEEFLKLLEQFYGEKEQEKYGVVVIHFKKSDDI